MAEQVEAIPVKLVALVLVPFLFGLGLLGLLFDLGTTGWAILYLVVFGGLGVLFIVGGRLYLLRKQSVSLDGGEG